MANLTGQLLQSYKWLESQIFRILLKHSHVYSNFNLHYFVSSIKYRTQLQFMFFHVFIYYWTSLQIFVFYKFFCTYISQVELEIHRILQPFLEAATGGVSWKKAILKYFVRFTGKQLWWGLITSHGVSWDSQENNCDAGHQACNLLKRDSNRDVFLRILGNL